MRSYAALLLLAGCATTRPLEARAVQPNLRAQRLQAGTLAKSQTLYVFEATGMRHVRIRSSAQFVVVDRNRLRFHLKLADSTAPASDTESPSTQSATVWLEDEHGRRYEPTREAAYVDTMVHPQWRFPRDSRCPFSCARHYRDIWLKYGTADYVFTGPDLIGPERKTLVLNVVRTRSRRPLRFVWTFDEWTLVQHSYPTRLDEQDHLFYAVPRADTMVLRSEPEADTF